MSTSEAITMVEAELSARDRRIERGEALLRELQAANRQLLADNQRLRDELRATESALNNAVEHADSLA